MTGSSASADRPRQTVVLIHGFSGSPASWTLVRPFLERRHDVLAATLPGHVGGTVVPRGAPVAIRDLVDDLERQLDAAELAQAHLAGASLGGWVALELAQRGRAASVVALSPAGGWEAGSQAERLLAEAALRTYRLAELIAPVAPLLVRSAGLRRRLFAQVALHGERVPPALALRLVRDTVRCTAYHALLEAIGRDGPPARELVAERGYTAHIRTRGEEIQLKLRTPGWRARRWVAEACHSWLNRNRGLLIRWSKKDEPRYGSCDNEDGPHPPNARSGETRASRAEWDAALRLLGRNALGPDPSARGRLVRASAASRTAVSGSLERRTSSESGGGVSPA